MAVPGSATVHNLASLPTLDEVTLLEHIKARYHHDIIYTYVGDMLVAVNPYRPLPIYGPEFEKRYCGVRSRDQLIPHLFAISDHAYQSMRRTNLDQCCVISGESGAGKTESTKLLVQHIVHLCDSQADERLHERILQVNPLLEAFGNAQTVLNNNSSRFGKYIELLFNTNGLLLGAQISEYLLEKSRVVYQAAGERNYHIFYYMFAGLHPEQLRVNLLDLPEKHRILQSNLPIYSSEAEFRFHQGQWERLRHIMDIVGFLPEEVNTILALLGAILHITDIQFEHDKDTDGVFIVDEQMLEMAAELLAVGPEELASCLISNVTLLRGERIVTLKNKEQANDGRDALAKALYARLFGWIVRQINFMFQPNNRYGSVGRTLGILDIAGFENCGENSFEQLCINTANEQLQFYFNQHIFQWELDEYKREGVKGKDIKFPDNRPLLQLLVQSGMCVLGLLDEESRFPQASDLSYLEKLQKNLANKKLWQRAKSQPYHFIINHYAAPVTYNVSGFLEKNRDTLSGNLLECMYNSESQIVVDLFTALLTDTGALNINPNAPRRSRKSLLLCTPMDLSHTKTRSLSKHAGKKLKEKAQPYNQMQNSADNLLNKTMGGQFKNSLTHLMEKLLNAEPQFVRCIKPNGEKKAMLFDPRMVMTQLKYTGVLETVKIRRLGYATRLPHAVFLARYKMIAYPSIAKVEPTVSNCSKLLKKAGLKDWEIGKTKVFLKYYHVEQLDMMMSDIERHLVMSQKVARGWLARRRFRAMRELSRQDAAAVRGFCIYVANGSDSNYLALGRQQTHDRERAERRKAELISAAKAAQMSMLAANAKLAESRPAVEKRPAPNSDLRPTSNSDLRPTSNADIRPNYRRVSTHSQEDNNNDSYQYPTETNQRAPVGGRKVMPGLDETSHLSNPAAFKSASIAFYNSIIDETWGKLAMLDRGVWGKLYYMEKSMMLAKVYLKNAEVIVDNSSHDYDGLIIGLGVFDRVGRDSTTEKIRKNFGKGVKLSIDEQGNVYAARITRSDVIAKGYKNTVDNCLSEEVTSQLGRLTSKHLKVFDMGRFKKHIGVELRKSSGLDERRLQRLCLVSLAIGNNTLEDMNTPCWLSLLNLAALRILGQQTVLREVIQMSRLSLTESEEQQLTREWSKLNPLQDEAYGTSSETSHSQSDQSTLLPPVKENFSGPENLSRMSDSGSTLAGDTDSVTSSETQARKKGWGLRKKKKT